MFNRLRYILLTVLLIAASQATGQYLIDKVCVGAERYYRIDGELNSTYTWSLTDTAGLEVMPISDTDDAIMILWDVEPGIYNLSAIQHAENGCPAPMELGSIEVFGAPEAFAGNDFNVCQAGGILLEEATAVNYVSLGWSTDGDGTFNNDTILNPIYIPGPLDMEDGNVMLTLVASGLGYPGTCPPALSTVTITLNELQVEIVITDATCFDTPDGSVNLIASGGTEPYSYTLNNITNSTGMFDGLLQGIYTYLVLDAAGCEYTGEVTVGVLDDMPPVITCPPNVTEYASDTSCSAFVNVLPATAVDLCATDSIWNDYNYTADASDIYNAGITFVTWYAIDNQGNYDSCMMMVSVIDTTPPQILCSNDTTVMVTSDSCWAMVNLPIPPTSDNCQVDFFENDYNHTTDASDIYPIGNTTVGWIVFDIYGNSASCSMTVTVIDTIPPTISCPPDMTATTGPDSCSAWVCIPKADVVDNCDNLLAINDYNMSYDATDVYPIGVTTVTWFVPGINPDSLSCSMTITVVDNQPPLIECPENISQNTDADACSAYVVVPPPFASDNCQLDQVYNDYTGTDNASAIYQVGITDVTWFATDIYGNSSSCMMNVTVIDSIPPVIICSADTVVMATNDSCWAQVGLPIPPTSDNCAVDYFYNSYNGTDDASDLYASGMTFVTWTVYDIYGNSSSCMMTVTVVDSIPPTITCPQDVTAYTGPDSCSAYVDVPKPDVTDNCSNPTAINDYNWTTDASDVYPVGVTTVTWFVADLTGNSISCSMIVTVLDNQPPDLDCPRDISQSTDSLTCTALVNVPLPVASDNCQLDYYYNDYTGTEDATAIYPAGTTQVTWIAWDIYGNSDTCDMNVTVIDSIIPIIICSADTIVSAGSDSCWAEVALPVPFSWDNCGVDTVFNDYTGTGNASGNYPSGTTTVTWTVYDIYGNSASCSMTVTVEDNVPPQMICPDDITVFAGPDSCSAWVAVPKPDVFDNCWIGIPVNDYNNTPDASDIYPVGMTIVTWTVSDLSGNTLTCTMTVSVIDNQPPVVNCIPEVTHPADTGFCEAYVPIPIPDAWDNCGIESVINSYNLTSDASDIYPVGVTPVTWIGTDIHGNVDSCFTVVMVYDSLPPQIICSPDTTVISSPDSCVALVTLPVPFTADNCGIKSLVNSFNGTGDASGSYPGGTTEVTWIVTDIYNNTNSCSMTVTVIDLTAPVIICPSDLTKTTDKDSCSAWVDVAIPIVMDNCNSGSAINDYNGTGDASDRYPTGTTAVHWTVFDEHGNLGSCTTYIHVIDLEKPKISCEDVYAMADTAACSTYVPIALPEVSDNCGVKGYLNDYNGTEDASDQYPLGTTEVTWTVEDIHGNTNNCVFNVFVTGKPLAVDDSASTLINVPVEIMIEMNDLYCESPDIEAGFRIIRDPYNGLAFITNNQSAVYNPDNNYFGEDSFEYELTDFTGAKDTATVYITVINLNLPPVAIDDIDSTSVYTPKIINILANDYDPDGYITKVELLTQPTNGTAKLMSDNTVLFSPFEDYIGGNDFTYKIWDNGNPALSDTARVIVLIFPENDLLEAPFIIYNALTPNGDGDNDYWKIKGIEMFPNNKIYLMDRWGNMIRIFESYNNTDNHWDGTNTKGQLMPNDTYYYVLLLSDYGMIYKGWVFLYR